MGIRKVLFAFDGPVFRTESGKYFGIHINNNVVDRYLNLGDKVLMLIRIRSIRDADSIKYTKLDHPGLEIIEMPDLKTISGFLIGSKSAKSIVSALVREVDIVVARIPSRTGNLAIMAAKKYSKPVIGEMVSCTLDAYWNYGFKGKLVAHYYFFKQRRIIRNLEFCVYVTKNYLQDKYLKTKFSINCSNVELIEANQNNLIDRINRIKNSNNLPLRLVTVGALNIRYKGHSDVIMAMYHLKKKHGIIFQYSIIGQGDSSRLVNLAKQLDVGDQLEVIGPLPNAKVLEFLRNVDLYIHPSLTEGLPRAVIEAMNVAVPVIATNAGGTPELLGNKNWYPKGDVNSLVDLLLTVNKEFLLNEAERSFCVAKDYNISDLNQRRNEFYKSFLEKNKLQNSQGL